MPDPAIPPHAASSAFAAITRELRRIASDDVEAALVRMQSALGGLSENEAKTRQARFRRNEVKIDLQPHPPQPHAAIQPQSFHCRIAPATTVD